MMLFFSRFTDGKQFEVTINFRKILSGLIS